MDYYQKYQKYKFKYLNLLNQSGGMTFEEAIKKSNEYLGDIQSKGIKLEGNKLIEEFYKKVFELGFNKDGSSRENKDGTMPFERMLEDGIKELRAPPGPQHGAPPGAYAQPNGAPQRAPPGAYGPPGAPQNGAPPGAYGPQHGAPPGPQQMQQQRQQQMQQQQRPPDLKTDLFNGLQHLKNTINLMEQKLTNGNL